MHDGMQIRCYTALLTGHKAGLLMQVGCKDAHAWLAWHQMLVVLRRVLSPCSSAHSALAASALFLALGCLAGAATDLACTCTCCAALGGRYLAVRTCSAEFRACHVEMSISLYQVACSIDV